MDTNTCFSPAVRSGTIRFPAPSVLPSFRKQHAEESLLCESILGCFYGVKGFVFCGALIDAAHLYQLTCPYFGSLSLLFALPCWLWPGIDCSGSSFGATPHIQSFFPAVGGGAGCGCTCQVGCSPVHPFFCSSRFLFVKLYCKLLLPFLISAALWRISTCVTLNLINIPCLDAQYNLSCLPQFV